MNTPASSSNGTVVDQSQQIPNPVELFALTDEQILNIQPDMPEAALTSGVAPASLPAPGHASAESRLEAGATQTNTALARNGAQAEIPASLEPPLWLAHQMNDPSSGAEARDLWNGIQQTQQEAAAYREVFAKPEEAHAAAQRARALDEIDAAFFGGPGKSPQELSAGRAALAQRMLQEDPVAFREMVFAGLRALESAAQSPTASANSNSALGPLNVAPPFRAASSQSVSTEAGLKPGASRDGSAPGVSAAEQGLRNTDYDAQLASYRAFEKSANDELERSVGGAIQHALEQALPNIGQRGDVANAGAPSRTFGIGPLQQRLAAAVREGVEGALKSDQQLGEQLGRLLAARRFDEATRAQVVRLINDRAQQLVPVSARRVIQEWTQTAFAAHRGKGSNADANGAFAQPPAPDASSAPPRSPAGPPATGRGASARAASPPVSAKAAAADRAQRDAGFGPRLTARPNGRPVDYSRLSDEQILDL